MTEDLSDPYSSAAGLAFNAAASLLQPTPVRSVLEQEIEPIDFTRLLPNQAEQAFQALIENIRRFEAKLDNDHEIGIRFSYGQDTIHIKSIGYSGTTIITFYGTNQMMEEVQLVQHVSQLNIYIVAVEKQQAQATRIGFLPPNKEKQ